MKKLGREFLQSRAFRIGVLGCLVVSMMVCTVFAAEGDTTSASSATIISAFEAGFQQIKSDAFAVLAVGVPVAVSIAAVIFIAKKAMSWFKSMAK